MFAAHFATHSPIYSNLISPMRFISQTFTYALITVASIFAASTQAQEKIPMQNVLNLRATASAPITPDTAVISLFAERTGVDAAAISSEVNALVADALKEAKQVAGVQAATGNFSTYQQYDNKGKQTGWVVRSDLILKSKDFGSLGKLAGNLSRALKIASNGFEVSRELKNREEEVLMQQGLALFQAKAKVASKALGFDSFTIREISLEQANLEGNQSPRPMMMARGASMDSAPADVPMQAGVTQLSLTVRGAVVMK
jgi:predicted secreted protein